MNDHMKETERLAHAYADAKLVRYGMNSTDPLSADPEQAFSALLAHFQRGAPDGWKEATIAWEVCASIHREYAKKKDPFFSTRQADFVRHTETARAALLAHIQRGAVPEGDERDEWEAAVFTLMGHAASLYFLGQSDMPNWFYELAEKLARRHVDEALAARVREVGIQQRAALTPAPDHFRDATKMMAEPAEVPMPKPVAYGFGNTAITGHTNRLMMVRIDIPGGDQYAGAFWLPLVLADEAHTYGAACRAAGEAAGYAAAVSKAVKISQKYGLADGSTAQQIAQEIAALRGEVKP